MSDPARLPVQGSSPGCPGDEESTARAIRDMFARVTPRYDFLNHLLSLGRDIAWRRATANALREVLARPGSRVVDLCCGTGDLTVALARYSAGAVIGADFCHPMLQLAQKKAQRRTSSIYFLEADTLALPFRDASLDAVAVAFGFRNLANYVRGVQEMRRVLRSRGLVAILEFSRVHQPVLGSLFRFYFHRILPRLATWISGVSGPYQYLPGSVCRFSSQQSLAALLSDAGFQNVRYMDFSGGVAALHLGEKA